MMSGFFQSVPFGITALVLVGSSWCLTGLVMGDAPKRGVLPADVMRIGSVVSIILGLLIMVCTGMYPKAPLSAMILACSLYFLAGAVNSIMCDIMSLAMQQGPNGIIWCIIQSGTIGPFLTGILFFNIRVNTVRLLGFLLLLGALICFGFGKGNEEKNKSVKIVPLVICGRVCGWKALAFIAFVLTAIVQSLVTIPSYFEGCRQITPIFRSIVLAAGFMTGIIVWGWYRKIPHPLLVPKTLLRQKWLWIYTCGLQFFSLIFAYLCLYPGMDILAKAGLGSMSYPIMVGSCIVAFTLSSVFLLREKIRLLQILALAGCIGGLICLCQVA